MRNDYKTLSDRIETKLHQHFALATSSDNIALPVHVPFRSNDSSARALSDDVAFAKVNTVSQGSPADIAGLKQQDLILRFGSVRGENNDKLGKVAQEVAQNEGVR